MTSQNLKITKLTTQKSKKHKKTPQNLDISRTKHYFLFKQKNSLITYQRLFYCKKKSFVVEVTFKLEKVA